MIKKINNIPFILILIVISVALISVFIIEHVLNYEPCKLCIYQRIPYFLSIFLIIKIIFIKKYEKITLLILSFVFFVSAVLAFYHFGIEQSFFSESSTCSTKDLTKILSKEALIEELKQNSVSCKDVSFKILGFSLAAINTIFSAFLSVIFIKFYLSYGKNQ